MSREVRVAEVIKKEVAHIIQHKLHDNRIGFISITDVEVSKDLSYAKVYVSTFGDEKARQRSIEGLEHATGFIKKELGRTLTLRQMPDLRFIDDTSIERGSRIISKLKELEQEREGHSESDQS